MYTATTMLSVRYATTPLCVRFPSARWTWRQRLDCYFTLNRNCRNVWGGVRLGKSARGLKPGSKLGSVGLRAGAGSKAPSQLLISPSPPHRRGLGPERGGGLRGATAESVGLPSLSLFPPHPPSCLGKFCSRSCSPLVCRRHAASTHGAGHAPVQVPGWGAPAPRGLVSLIGACALMLVLCPLCAGRHRPLAVAVVGVPNGLSAIVVSLTFHYGHMVTALFHYYFIYYLLISVISEPSARAPACA